MKWRRQVFASFTAGMVVASIFLTVSRSAAANEIDEILRAYMRAPDVATEIGNYRKEGYQDHDARGMEVSGSCGVAGCSVEYLVV